MNKYSFLLFLSLIFSNSYSQDTTSFQNAVVNLFYNVPLRVSYVDAINELKKSPLVDVKQTIESDFTQSNVIILKGNPILKYMGEQATVQYFDRSAISEDFRDRALRSRSLTMTESRTDSLHIQKLKNEFKRIVTYFKALAYKNVEDSFSGTDGKYAGVSYDFYTSQSSFFNKKPALHIAWTDMTADEYSPVFEFRIFAFEDFFF